MGAIWIWILAAAIDGLLAVAGGAAGRHLLAGDPQALEWLMIGAQYAMYHALALLALAALAGSALGGNRMGRLLAAAAWLFILGSVLFSGSLAALAFGGPSWLVRITPWGGTAFLLGWAALAGHAVVAVRRRA